MPCRRKPPRREDPDHEAIASPSSVRTAALAFAFALCAPLIVAPAFAQSAAEVKELLTTLAPRHQENMPSAIIVRRPVEIEIDGDTVIADYGYTLDFEVSFEFDSARLTGAAKRTLAALGRALKSRELIGYHYLIAGHTDAKGSAYYNRALSYDRASAVRDWLIARYAIDPRRLHVIGWGESRLKTPRFPFAAVNRRVEVTLIMPAEVILRPHPGATQPARPLQDHPCARRRTAAVDPSAKGPWSKATREDCRRVRPVGSAIRAIPRPISMISARGQASIAPRRGARRSALRLRAT